MSFKIFSYLLHCTRSYLYDLCTEITFSSKLCNQNTENCLPFCTSDCQYDSEIQSSKFKPLYLTINKWIWLESSMNVIPCNLFIIGWAYVIHIHHNSIVLYVSGLAVFFQYLTWPLCNTFLCLSYWCWGLLGLNSWLLYCEILWLINYILS